MDVIEVAALLFDAGADRIWRRADCISRWPVAVRALEAAHLLPTIGIADEARCAACGDFHDVELGREPVLRCPIAGNIGVKPLDLAQVGFDQNRWLEQVGAALSMAPPENCIPGTLWRFNKQHAAGWRKQIWIGRGLGAAHTFDAAARAIRNAGRQAKWLLTSSTLPLEAGPALGAELICFVDCATITEAGQVVVDLEAKVGPRKQNHKARPGRKKKVGPAQGLFDARVKERAVLPVLADEARAIHALLLEAGTAAAEVPSERTIEDAIRNDHAKAVGRPRPVKP